MIPPEVFIDDFEDLLATDALFVDYFNEFLQLPTFPEPLFFNKENGGFEILTDAKKELASQIKAVFLSSQRKKKIYRHVTKHSFSAIPLIPIEKNKEIEHEEIDTTFSVTTLNKEQGIQWVKRERLPHFLESDHYLEYRLAKLMSQVKIFPNISSVQQWRELKKKSTRELALALSSKSASRGGDDVSVVLDYEPHIRNVEEEEVEEEPPADESEQILRQSFVSLGNTSKLATEEWVNQAKQVMKEASTGTTERPHSALDRVRGRSSPVHVRPLSGRPYSARSNFSKNDSGVHSANKPESSVDMSVYTASLLSTGLEHDDIPFGGDFNETEYQTGMPRPSDDVCAISSKHGTLVYAPLAKNSTSHHSVKEQPKESTMNEEPEDQGIGDDLSMSVSIAASTEEKHQANSIEKVAEHMAGTAIKSALCDVTKISEAEIEKDDRFKHSFNGCDVHKQSGKVDGSRSSKKSVDFTTMKEKEDMGLQEENMNTIIGDENESDEDSVLGSDNDYEGERDDFFRKTKYKTFNLKNKNGIDAFKKFLVGSEGEKNWLFWMDAERAKFLSKDPDLLQSFIVAMRERYQKTGGEYELSQETKKLLQLVEPSNWNLEKISKVQTKMAEPLVLYWAPRFLMKQDVKVNPNNNVVYHHQKTLMPRQYTEAHKVAPVLPLRPKSCIPTTSFTHNVAPRKPSVYVENAYEKEDQKTEELKRESSYAVTSPPVGMKRVYNLPEAFQTAEMKKSGRITPHPRVKSKSPRKLITASLRADKNRRPMSAPPARNGVNRSGDSNSNTWEVKSNLSHSDSISEHNSDHETHRSKSIISTASLESEISEFAGGRRMEGLLQALHNEKRAGGVIRKFISRSDNQLWKNCLDFWEGLQQYHTLFYAEILDPWLLRQKARTLYSRYLATSSTKPIECDRDIVNKIYHKVNPPYEDVFDDAEEYTIGVLFDAWADMLKSDIATFGKVELIEVRRHLKLKAKYILSLQKKGILKEREETPQEEMEGLEDPVYDNSLWEKLPPEFQDWNLDKLVRNRLELEHFKSYLVENYASMDLMAWTDIEAYRRIPHIEEKKRDMKAKDVKLKYFTKKYFFGPNSPAGRESQEKVMQIAGGWGKLLEERLSTNCMLEAQKFVKDRLEKNWLPRFLATEEFQERQRPKIGMDDAVEDVMIQKKKKSQAIWKILESKWISSSKDIMAFRKALTNPVTSQQFRKFVSVKGDNFENDVLFYQEVQKYKDLCHIHSERSLMQQKTLAIINCFIDSAIPPTLQIDIPQEMADRLIERKLEASPYLFRESQLTVFRVLASHWNDFSNFRSSLTDDKLLTTLDRHRRKAKNEEKKRQKEIELKKEKLEAQRKAMGLPESAELEDGGFDPFTKGSDEEDNAEKGDKHSVSWSYSQYRNSIDRENVLNYVDSQTFSSVTAKPSDPSVKPQESASRKLSARRSSQQKVETTDSACQTLDQKSSHKKVNCVTSEEVIVGKKSSSNFADSKSKLKITSHSKESMKPGARIVRKISK